MIWLAITNAIMEKQCSKCKETKSVDLFGRLSSTKDGYRYYCKSCKYSNDKKYNKTEAGKRCVRLRGKKYYEKNKHTEKYKEWSRQATLRSRARSPLKYKARTAVGNALKLGNLKRLPCKECGVDKAEAHHCDYNKPLDVMWLCRHHHNEWHKNNVAIT